MSNEEVKAENRNSTDSIAKNSRDEFINDETFNKLHDDKAQNSNPLVLEGFDEDVLLLGKKKPKPYKESFDDIPIETIAKRTRKLSIEEPIEPENPLSEEDCLVNVTESEDNHPREEIAEKDRIKNFDAFASVDSEVFQHQLSEADEHLDLLKLREIEEQVDKSRASTPEWEAAFTPRQVFFLSKNQEN